MTGPACRQGLAPDSRPGHQGAWSSRQIRKQMLSPTSTWNQRGVRGWGVGGRSSAHVPPVVPRGRQPEDGSGNGPNRGPGPNRSTRDGWGVGRRSSRLRPAGAQRHQRTEQRGMRQDDRVRASRWRWGTRCGRGERQKCQQSNVSHNVWY